MAYPFETTPSISSVCSTPSVYSTSSVGSTISTVHNTVNFTNGGFPIQQNVFNRSSADELLKTPGIMNGQRLGFTNQSSSRAISGYTYVQPRSPSMRQDTIYWSRLPTPGCHWQPIGNVYNNCGRPTTTGIIGNQIHCSGFQNVYQGATHCSGGDIRSSGLAFGGDQTNVRSSGVRNNGESHVLSTKNLMNHQLDASQQFLMTNITSPQGVAQANQQQCWSTESCSSTNTIINANMDQLRKDNCVSPKRRFIGQSPERQQCKDVIPRVNTIAPNQSQCNSSDCSASVNGHADCPQQFMTQKTYSGKQQYQQYQCWSADETGSTRSSSVADESETLEEETVTPKKAQITISSLPVTVKVITEKETIGFDRKLVVKKSNFSGFNLNCKQAKCPIAGFNRKRMMSKGATALRIEGHLLKKEHRISNKNHIKMHKVPLKAIPRGFKGKVLSFQHKRNLTKNNITGFNQKRITTSPFTTCSKRTVVDV
jgi:hypothetical protein